MTAWWRRNALALVAIGVLIPATVGAVAVQEWSERVDGFGTAPVVIAEGEVADYMLATIGDARAAFVDDPEAPSGARVVEVTVRVIPDLRTPLSCLSPQLREQGGLQRQWDESSDALGRDYDLVTSCSRSARAPYTLSLAYVVPEDASGPFTVDVGVFSANPTIARLQVAP